MRLGGDENDDVAGDNGARGRVHGQPGPSVFNDKRRVVIAGVLFLFLFFMLKNSTSKDYDDSTREYYKSIGMESTARASMTKTELEKERVQLLTQVRSHEKIIDVTTLHIYFLSLSRFCFLFLCHALVRTRLFQSALFFSTSTKTWLASQWHTHWRPRRALVAGTPLQHDHTGVVIAFLLK